MAAQYASLTPDLTDSTYHRDAGRTVREVT